MSDDYFFRLLRAVADERAPMVLEKEKRWRMWGVFWVWFWGEGGVG